MDGEFKLSVDRVIIHSPTIEDIAAQDRWQTNDALVMANIVDGQKIMPYQSAAIFRK